jgi:zinc protease
MVGNHSARSRRIGSWSAAAAVVLIALGAATVSRADAAFTPVTSVEGITEYKMANGLRVLLFPDTSKPTVTVNITYMVGSRHEGYGETGMAHLLEHMLFKGTTRHLNPWQEMQDHGANFNGETWTDRTNYYETVAATRQNLEWALDLEADRMLSSRISREDLAKEFSVVRNEFEMGENNPRQILEERMFSSAYLWHNYGKSTIGSKTDIERVPVDNLRAFYTKYYQPDNALLVVAGKIDPKETLGLIEKYFAKLPRPSRKLSPTYTVEPVQDGERDVILRRTGDVQLAGLMYHGLAGADEDFVAEDALVTLLTDKPSGRLYKALVEKGLAATVDGTAYPWADPGVMELYAKATGKHTAQEVQAQMIQVVESLAKAPFTTAEVERYKTRSLKEFELTMADSQQVAVLMSNWAAMGDWRLMFLYRDHVRTLTPARVQAVAARFVKPSNRTAGLFLPTTKPERAPLVVAPDVAKQVAGYKGDAQAQAGEVFDATLDNIEKRTTKIELQNGLKIAMLPKKTRGAAVKIELRLHFGREADLRGKMTAARTVARMLTRGTQKHTFQQIHDELDRLKADIDIRPGNGEDPNQATVSITTVHDSVPQVLALLAECLQQPTFPKDQFELVRKELNSQLSEQLQDPNAQGFNTMTRKLSPYGKDDVRYVPTIAEGVERIAAMKLADVVAIHKALWGTSFAELSLVGDFDRDPIEKVLRDKFGSWKSPHPFERIKHQYTVIGGAEETVSTPDKQMALVMMGERVQLRDDDPDFPAMTLANFVLGGGAKSRLIDRLRQKDGLSYGAFSFIEASAWDPFGTFVATAICAPQNVPKAVTAMREEIVRWATGAIPAPELADAKAAYKQTFDNSLTEDGNVAAMLAANLYEKRTTAFIKQLNDRIAALKPEDIARALKKHIRTGELIRVVAGDVNPEKAAR